MKPPLPSATAWRLDNGQTIALYTEEQMHAYRDATLAFAGWTIGQVHAPPSCSRIEMLLWDVAVRSCIEKIKEMR